MNLKTFLEALPGEDDKSSSDPQLKTMLMQRSLIQNRISRLQKDLGVVEKRMEDRKKQLERNA